MRPNSKIYATVAAILGAPAAAVVFAAPADQSTATTATTASENELQEVIVTANRREQNLQDVPISIQALTGAELSKLSVSTLEDYVKYLPNVSTGTLGPGQGTVFMRGLSVGVLGTQGQGSVGGFPNVAVYLDDQSAQLPGRNLDVYAADLARIEVLEGPQGTLFGAGAQAGVIRYITNKPKLNVTEANFEAGYGTTAHGANNSNATAVLNLPLTDTLAVRGVFYTDSRGGYIDNVPSTFTRSGTDLGLTAENGGVVPSNNPTWNNFNVAANNINPVTYQGLRLSMLWKMNDDWDALLQQSYQNMDAQGVFYEMPNGSEGTQISAAAVPFGGQPLAPLQVTLFQPNYDRDRFENTALTVTGKIADLKLVYAGSYLVRNIDQVQDYTNYSRGRYAYYYQCVGVTYSRTSGSANAFCYSPLDTWHDTERNTHLSQELRLSLPDDWRLRGLVGLFYEDYKIEDDTAWLYRTVPDCSAALPDNCFHPLQPLPGGGFNNPNVRNAAVGFNDDFQRSYKQRAAFASVDFDIIPKVLTITGGTRYYHIDNKINGGDLSSFGCKEFSATNTYFGPCTIAHELRFGTDINLQNPNSTRASGFRSRANLSWHITPDQLLYVTWSQGYRAGGFNRGTASVLPDANGVAQYIKPGAFASDDLTNKEIGWKTEWFDHHLLVNGAVYKENWNNVQTGLFCPTCGLGNLTFGVNGPDYEVKGVELQVNWLVVTGFSLTGSASWNSSELTNSPALVNNNPASPTFGQAIHLSGNLYGNPGSPLANSPPFQANLRGRYSWDWNGYQPFVQAGFQHQSHSVSATGYVATFDQPNWTTADLTVGLSKEAWVAQLVGTNITDVNKSLFTSARQWIVTETPMRPRTIELRVSYSFQNK